MKLRLTNHQRRLLQRLNAPGMELHITEGIRTGWRYHINGPRPSDHCERVRIDIGHAFVNRGLVQERIEKDRLFWRRIYVLSEAGRKAATQAKQ